MSETKWPEVVCRLCGATQAASYCEPIQGEMVSRRLCFTCNFWHDKVAERNRPDAFRAKGWHYTIGDEDKRIRMRGFDGARGRVTFMDGRETVESTNLWCQGEIPQRWRTDLPDNATLEWFPYRPTPHAGLPKPEMPSGAGTDSATKSIDESSPKESQP